MRKLLVGIIVLLLLVVVAIAAFLFVPSPLQKWALTAFSVHAQTRPNIRNHRRR